MRTYYVGTNNIKGNYIYSSNTKRLHSVVPQPPIAWISTCKDKIIKLKLLLRGGIYILGRSVSIRLCSVGYEHRTHGITCCRRFVWLATPQHHSTTIHNNRWFINNSCNTNIKTVRKNYETCGIFSYQVEVC